MSRTYTLNTYNHDTLHSAFSAIPEDATSLKFNRDAFVNDSSITLALALAALSASVTVIDVSYNSLHLRTVPELIQIFSAIPVCVTSLELRRNGLGKKTALELAQIFAAIPASVRSLDLGWNDFDRWLPADLAQAFAVIPEGVNVSLTHNRLFNTTLKTCVERDALLVALRKKSSSGGVGISCNLRLSYNGEDEIQRILPALACLYKKPVKEHNYDVNIILLILSYLNCENRSLKTMRNQFNRVFQMMMHRPSLNNTLAIGANFERNEPTSAVKASSMGI